MKIKNKQIQNIMIFVIMKLKKLIINLNFNQKINSSLKVKINNQKSYIK